MILKFLHDNIPIENTLLFEEEYPEKLRLNKDQKQKLKDDGAEFIHLLNQETGGLIGETFLIEIDRLKEEIPGLKDWKKKNGVYVYGTTILKEYQGKKFGSLLKGYFYGYIKDKYEIVMGHAREGRSLELNISFGAVVQDRFDNWYGTGETYFLYKKDLI